MRKISLLLLLFGFGQALVGQAYRYHVDLNKVDDDLITVELDVPDLPDLTSSGTIRFHLPKIVPGTYDIYDFGRFVSDFEAFDAEGKSIAVSHPDANTWVMDQTGLAKVRYKVADTWDAYDLDNFVFEPGGTNIEDEENFVLNGHGVFGWFAGLDNVPFEVRYTHPKDWFGSCAIKGERKSATEDIFTAADYFHLVDAPLMYCKPDTTVIRVGDTDVLISVYSKGGEVNSEFVAEEIHEILLAQQAYLGGTLPVERYAFIIYLFDGFSGSGSYGALEHHTSSFYFLPDLPEELMSSTLRDMAAHEFFHIVTPLNIHSEHIQDFDFLNPTMSKHLWLYEGVTEYSAGHVQVREGLITFEEYMNMLEEKTGNMMGYNDELPFTEMSEFVLDKYEDEYGNVYEKGALIGMCLDLTLRKYSKGEYGIQNLMRDLAQKYGPDQPFKDDDLFREIESLTFPEAGDFLRNYVGGPRPLPLQEVLGWVGIHYQLDTTLSRLSLGFSSLVITEEGEIAVGPEEDINEFGRKIGLQEGDVFVSLNGRELNFLSFGNTLRDFMEGAEEGDKVMLVMKRNTGGKEKEVKCKGKMYPVDIEISEMFVPYTDPSKDQLMLRKAWLGDYKTLEE